MGSINGIQENNNYFQLRSMRQKIVDSLDKQKQAVSEKLNLTNEQKSATQLEYNGKKVDLDQAITILSNFEIPKHSMEEPNKAEYQLEVEDPDNGGWKTNDAEVQRFKADTEKWEAEEKAIKEAEAQKKQLEADVNTKLDTVESLKGKLDELVKVANDVEKQSLDINGQRDAAIQDLAKIDEQIKNSKVEINGSSNNKGMVDQTIKMLKENGAITTEQEAALRKDPSKLKELAGKYVNFDNTNTGRSEADGMTDGYRKGKYNSSTMSGSQMDELTGVAGAKYSVNDTWGSENLNNIISNIPNKPSDADKPELPAEPKPEAKPDEAATDPNAHYKKNGVTFARGIPYNSYGDDPAKWGVYQDDTGNYSIRDIAQAGINVSLHKDPGTIRNLSDDELNAAMRKAEETVHQGYSKLLDKAENFDIDIDSIVKPGMSGNEAYNAVKKAVKAKEAEAKQARKLNEAEQEYATEIQKYGLESTSYSTAKELKTAINNAEEIDKYASRNASKIASLGINVTEFKTVKELKAAIEVAEQEAKATREALEREEQAKMAAQAKYDATSGTTAAFYEVEESEDHLVISDREIPLDSKELSNFERAARGEYRGSFDISINGKSYTVTPVGSGNITVFTIGDQNYTLKDNKLIKVK